MELVPLKKCLNVGSDPDLICVQDHFAHFVIITS